MRKVIYTAITADYDRLQPIPYDFRREWGAVCFTDGEIPPADGWEIVRISGNGLPPIGLSKKVKALSHQFLPWADLSLWIDASLVVKAPLDEYVGRLPDEDLILIRHPERNCVYDEMDACIQLNKAEPESIESQRNFYQAIGFPHNWGLFKAGILLRKKSERVADFNFRWWVRTMQFANWRDQLSLPLVLREMRWHPALIEDSILRPFFKQIVVHRKRKGK